MNTTDAACPGLAELIARLDRSVEQGSSQAITAAVKADLEEILGGGRLALPAAFIKPRADAYARRLLHRDPNGRYSAIVMTWGPGQGTAVHDHGGLWCVEGVVDGEIAVTQYLVQQESDGYYRVTPIGSLLAGTGSAGCLIPPTDHHVLANARPARASVTLHIYGGDLDDCKVFLPATPDGRYAETTRMLSFNE
ncbi:MAG TPA: cysteine dioxygenase family protein [Vicinamibacterales bacterium]|nr:cysteine dioxygenase family protein [Vicinamibacterales bacterium]